MASNKPIGTTHSGYSPSECGPFECCRCAHWDGENRIGLFASASRGEHVDGYCDHPDVVKDATAGDIPKDKKGACVQSGGCCTYFRPSEKNRVGVAIAHGLISLGGKARK